jgi:hypothetical protein
MSTSVVDEFYSDYKQLLKLLESSTEASLRVWANDRLNRTLVLVSANHFESEVKGILVNLLQKKSGSPLLASFLQKSMERRYHEYFDWHLDNANRFFSLFGEDFKKKSLEEVKAQPKLMEGMKAFMEIGRTRNDLVHKQLLGIQLLKTADEFYELHKKALVFVDYVRTSLG